MSKRVLAALIVALFAFTSGATTVGADPPSPLDHTPAYEADQDLLDMFLAAPEVRDAEAMALAYGSPPCVPFPKLRTHDVDGSVAAIQLSDCIELPEFAMPLETFGGCDTPSSTITDQTPIWYTVYVDAEFWAERDAVKEASALNRYLHAMYDGEFVHGINQPRVKFCPNYVLPVPADPLGTNINNGDIDTTDHLEELIDYEAGFSDPGQFLIVFGWNKIKDNGASVNGIALGEVGDFPEATGAYFHYWGGSPYVGFRLAFHEVGHVFDAGHSTCNSGMAVHNFIHIMAFSNDRDSSCNWSTSVPHSHWIFKGADAGIVDATYAEWCSERKGSAC